MSVESLMVRQDVVSERLDSLSKQFQEKGDTFQANKMEELMSKWEMGEFVLAFCGHFSAGKSTMINTLMGKEILPSSPIPTSANVVKVKSGEAKAIVYLKNKPPVSFDYVQELEKLKELCKDGDEVVSVEIFHPNDFLVNDACLLDTPGIDSTDAAHKVATESAMHLADVVVYMMDYNHVQSEINFQFTKTLKEKGKTLFLVINQIDKHFDLELDFTAFKQSVEESFEHWGVYPDAIFYTTLKIPEHPENQLEELHDRLYSLFCQKDRVLQESVLRSAQDLIHEHEQFLEGIDRETKQRLEKVIGEAKLDEVAASFDTLQKKLQTISKRPEMLRNEAMKELQSLVESANITPFSMREWAGKYLESIQQGFKVGFLFSAGKTKQEKEDRLAAFHKEVAEQVKANLEWHVRELLHRVSKTYQVPVSPELMEEMDHVHVPITTELLAGCVKQGARVTGDAVLNYCHNLAGEIKGRYRRLALDILERLVQLSKVQASLEENQLREESADVLQMKKAIEDLHHLDEQQQHYIQELQHSLFKLEEDGIQIASSAKEMEAHSLRSWKEKGIPTLVKKEKVDSLVLQGNQRNVSPFKKDYKSKILTSAQSLRKAAEWIKGLRGQSLAAKHMRLRADRLEKNLFTVALFGAFSAGKSSFANAMMGEMILPVSPNPTTATINKILPPTGQYPHGTVRVKIKSEQDMTKDVLQSLHIFRLEGHSIQEAIAQLGKIEIEQILPSAKPHFSFLNAVKKGASSMDQQYGQELLVGMEEFKELVAREDKACFVEWIELYYSCPLTDQGISLVDTPGADSINARHTGVAFDYIKNADAVLFVTYYNHAFSHADREFLQQLGRVKDTFEMDKMFFLVNAADLARSKDELLGVVEHVKENLLACGIRHPRLYPVSSQTALLARMLAAGSLSESAERVYRERTHSSDELMTPADALTFSGFEQFERDFIQFTIEELTEVAIQSAMGEIKRSQLAIQALIQTAKQGQEERNKKRIANIEAKEQDLLILSQASFEREKGKLEKEVEELLYYVKQRLFFKFNELYSLSFNPAVIKEEKGRDLKHILVQCFDELKRNMAFTLTQEMRASSLRVEKAMNQLGKAIFQEIMVQLGSHVEDEYQPARWEVPVIPEEIDYEQAEVKKILNQFKSPKHFFEQGGRETMRTDLENWATDPISAFIHQCMMLLKDYYTALFLGFLEEMKEQLKEQVEEYYAGVLGALEDDVDIHVLEKIEGNLENIRQIMI